MKPVTAVFPGTFDPLTSGHLNIIKRAVALFGDLQVAVAASPGKHTMLSLATRVALARECCTAFPGVQVCGFENLLIEHLRACGARVLIRALRSAADYDYEEQLGGMYRMLLPELEIVMLQAPPEFVFLSSSLVREVLRHGGAVDAFVPAAALPFLRATGS